MIKKIACFMVCMSLTSMQLLAGSLHDAKFKEIEKKGKELQGKDVSLHVTVREVKDNGDLRVVDKDGQLRIINIPPGYAKKIKALRHRGNLTMLLNNLKFRGNKITGVIIVKDASGLVVDDSMFVMICSSEHKW